VYGIPPTTPLKLHLRCGADVATDMRDVASQFETLCKTMLEAAGAEVERPKASASFSLGDADGFVPLEGVIDREAELARKQKEADKLQGFINGHEKKLANKRFVDNAPADVVAQVRETLAGLQNQLQSVQDVIRELEAN
jgi:valyl-tRNA synthetase